MEQMKRINGSVIISAAEYVALCSLADRVKAFFFCDGYTYRFVAAKDLKQAYDHLEEVLEKE
jgi:hypothetical protein